MERHTERERDGKTHIYMYVCIENFFLLYPTFRHWLFSTVRYLEGMIMFNSLTCALASCLCLACITDGRTDGWMNGYACHRLDWMYPTLIDHDSPFDLSVVPPGAAAAVNSSHDQDIRASDGLSYGMVNMLLHCYISIGCPFVIMLYCNMVLMWY